MILVSVILGSISINWAYEKDWTTLSRDGDVIAQSKWTVEAERTYINLNSWYRTNVMCPRIIEAGGYKTATRCYYPDETYEPLSRSLINTKITLDEFYDEKLITKITPHYKYGTRGAYAGKVIESMLFDEATKHEEDFPKDYSIDWNPTDTRNYKLVWRLEKLDTSDYIRDDIVQYIETSIFIKCAYTFGHVKIDLKDDCDKLDYVDIKEGKATFYFKPMKAEQILDIDFVDPPVEEVIKRTGLQITHNSDTKGSVVQNEEPFHISIDTSTVRHGWINKSDNTTRYAIYGKGLFWTDENGIVPNGTKYFGISFGEKATTGWIKHKNAFGSTWSTINSGDFNHLNSYTFDNNKTYDDVYYTTFATIPSNHTRDFKLYIELLDKPKRDNFIIYFGTGSTVLEVDIGTDLKIVQTGLSNTTDYVASIDVSNGLLLKGQTDSDYDLTDGLVLWQSFDNGNYSGTWGTTAYDYSGWNNHGTLTNMNTGLDNCTDGCSGWTSSGNLSYGMAFNGTDDYIDCGNDLSLNLTDLTAEAWVYKKSTGTQQAVFSKRYLEWMIRFETDNDYNVLKSNGAGGHETFDYNINWVDNQWNHLVSVFDSSSKEWSVYLNGVWKYTYTFSSSSLDNPTNHNLYIGKRQDAGAGFYNTFNGTIDDVRIWNVAKSATEIEALYNLTVDKYETKITELSSSAVTYDVISNSNTSAIVNVPEVETDIFFTPTYVTLDSYRSSTLDGGNNGLVGRWSFDYPTGSIAFDSSGNGNDGTISGAVFTDDTHNNTGYAINFDDITDQITLGNDASLYNATSKTYSLWFKPTVEFNSSYASGDDWDLIRHASSNWTMFRLDDVEGKARFGFTSGSVYSNTTVWNAGQWYYFVGTYDSTLGSGNLKMYVNGTLINSVDVTDDIPVPEDNLRFNFNTKTQGIIDNVNIYNRALSATEIADIYSNDLPKYKNITMNTTNSDWFGQETVTVTESYLDEANLTRVRVTNPFDVGIYDLYLFNLTEYLSWNPNNLLGVWYDSYTGNSDNSTLKDTSDWSQWVDTCNAGNTTGMVGCWNFNELDGTIAKDRANNSANNNDGTLTNMNTGKNNASSGWNDEGKYGGAIKCDGVDDYVDYGSDASLDNLTEFSVSSWIKPQGLEDYKCIQAKGSSINSRGWFFQVMNNANIRFYRYATIATTSLSNNAPLTLNEWSYVVAVYNTNRIAKLYVNSVEVTYDTQQQGSGTITDATGDILAQGRGGSESSAYFNGTIDEVKIFNVAKDQAWITAEYERSKDYYDSITLQEGAISAGADQDYFLANGTVSTCLCPVVGNWGIDCSDNCAITTCDMSTRDVSLSGSGTTTGLSNIINYVSFTISGGCDGYA